jgi:hypothetical protein
MMMTDPFYALVHAQYVGARSLAISLDLDDTYRRMIAEAYGAAWADMPEMIQFACEVSFYVGQRKARGGDGGGFLLEMELK